MALSLQLSICTKEQYLTPRSLQQADFFLFFPFSQLQLTPNNNLALPQGTHQLPMFPFQDLNAAGSEVWKGETGNQWNRRSQDQNDPGSSFWLCAYLFLSHKKKKKKRLLQGTGPAHSLALLRGRTCFRGILTVLTAEGPCLLDLLIVRHMQRQKGESPE